MTWALAEQDRRLAGVIRTGNVAEVDAGAGRARIAFGGGAVSGWIPWVAARSSGVKVWAPPAVGEQVLVASPGGDTAQGWIVGSAFAGGAAPSSRGDEYRIEIGAAAISAVPDALELAVGGASIRLEAGGIVLSVGGAELRLSGDGLDVAAPALTHRGVDVGDGHKHDRVSRGDSETGKPVG